MMTVQTSKRSLRNNRKGDSFPSKQTLLAKALQASVGIITAAALCVPLPSLAKEFAITGNETEGKVTIPNDKDGSSITGDVAGYYDDGSSVSGITVTGGSVTINEGGSVSGSVYGGYLEGSDENGSVTKNTVEITTGEIGSNVYGGYSNSGTISNNEVIINGGSITSVYGGRSNNNGTATYNTVTINGGSISNNVNGGSSYSGDVTSNTVKITDSSIGSSVYGGSSQSGVATSNTVTIEGDSTTIGGQVDGGLSQRGDATYNKVTINGGTISSYVDGGRSNNGTVSNNEVTITGGMINSYVGGGESYSEGDATYNKVTITGGTVSGSVKGGYSDLGKASSNTVTITGGSIGADVYGADGYTDVSSNTVTIAGGSISGDVYGGASYIGDATYNTVTLSGGKMGEDTVIYAGYGAGDVSNNKINLYGTTDDNGNLTIADTSASILYGRNDDAAEGSGNNTLNIGKGYIGGTAKNIVNFDAVSVDLTGLDLSNAGATKDGSGGAILTLTDTDGTDLNNSTITVSSSTTVNGLSGVTAKTSQGLADRYNIIANTNGVTVDDSNVTTKTVNVVSGIEYSVYTLDTMNGTSIGYDKGTTDLLPGNGAFTANAAATLAFLNGAADFVLDRKLQCSVREDGSIPDVCFYGAVSGGDLNHDLNHGSKARTTGSHWFLGVRGKLNDRQDTAKDINAALWVEAGWGDVRAHDHYASAKGNTNYYGLGVLAEHRQKEGAWKGTYAQVHAKVGKAFTDVDSSIRDANDKKIGYNEHMTYYGAGLEFGYEWTINPNYMLDTGLKYRWLHMEGFNADLGGTDTHFDDINSHRTRLGTRLNYTENKLSSPYIGVAWEHEFSGTARGHADGLAMDESSLKGDSGVLEVGFKFTPSEKSPWNVDFSVEGYVGQRDGVMGNFTLNYLF